MLRRALSEPFVNGTIAGRPASAIVGAAMAIYNVLVVFAVFGFTPTTEQNAAVNAAICAVIILLANSREQGVQVETKALLDAHYARVQELLDTAHAIPTSQPLPILPTTDTPR